MNHGSRELPPFLFFKALTLLQKNKKKIDLLLMSVSVSSAIRNSQEGSHGGLTDVLCRNPMMIKQTEKAASNAQKNTKLNRNCSKSKTAPHLRTMGGGKEAPENRAWSSCTERNIIRTCRKWKSASGEWVACAANSGHSQARIND